MNKSCVTGAINALETAYHYILVNVPPGTKGKLEAVEELRQNATRMVYEYAHHKPLLPVDRPTDA
jgi:hypothetical protein